MKTAVARSVISFFSFFILGLFVTLSILYVARDSISQLALHAVGQHQAYAAAGNMYDDSSDDALLPDSSSQPTQQLACGCGACTGVGCVTL